jgi:hypothetical protein
MHDRAAALAYLATFLLPQGEFQVSRIALAGQ